MKVVFLTVIAVLLIWSMLRKAEVDERHPATKTS